VRNVLLGRFLRSFQRWPSPAYLHYGYLSDQVAGNIGSLSINYERFQRVTRVAHFTFRIPGAGPGEIYLNAPFQNIYTIENIQPEPAHSTADNNSLRLSFAKLGGQPLVVDIWVKPERFGWFDLNAQSTSTPVTFSVLIYP
jgi:hypothetical protein